MPYAFSIIRIFLVTLGLLTLSFFNILKSLGGYEHPGDKFGFVLGSVLGSFGISLVMEFILFLITRKGRDQVKKSYQKKENLEDAEHITKQSYFSDVEIEKMEGKFLNFGELLFNVLKLFRRSWLKAWLRPVLWVLLLLLSFVFGAFVLGLFFALIYNILIIYNNYIALIILFLVIAAVAISAYLLLIWGLIQASIRNLVLIDNKNASFWRHGFDIWSIFCKRLGVAFLFFSINFAFTILYLQLQILNLFIDYRNVLSWLVLLAYASLVAWFNYTIFLILSLVTFKDFNVMQSVRATLAIIKGNFKRIFFRYFWISLIGVLVMAIFSGISFLIVYQMFMFNLTEGYSDLIFNLEAIFVVMMLLLFIWILYTIFYYIQYTSFTNLIHFAKLKSANHYNWTGRKYKLFNTVVIISIFIFLFEFSYYPVLAKDFEL